MSRATAAGVLAVAAAALFLPALGARDLWNPNEPIYGLAVREMAESSAWLVPTVNGREFAEKPILYFWLARLTSLPAGLDEGSLRLPSAAAGMALVVGVFLLAEPYAGRRRAGLAAAMTGTCYAVFWGARTVQMDILLAATTLWTVLPVVRVADHGLRPVVGFVLSGLAAGCGFLAKGPVGWILPGIVVVGYLVASRRPKLLVSRHVAAAIAVAVAVVLPWLAALWLDGRIEFLREMLFRQNFERFTNAWDHSQPWWYYLRYLWVDMAPWSLLLPAAALRPDPGKPERRLELLSWIWILGTIAFFSMSESKRSAYILPVAPAVAILASGVAARWASGLPRAVGRYVLTVYAALGAALIAAAAVAVVWVPREHPEFRGPATALAPIVGVAGVAILVAIVSGARGRIVPWVATAAVGAAMLAVVAVGLPAANEFKSARAFCDAARDRSGEGAEIVGWGLWRWRAEYPYYLRRTVPLYWDAGELRARWQSRPDVFVIAENDGIEEVRALLPDAVPLVERRIGSRAVALLGPRATANHGAGWQTGQ